MNKDIQKIRKEIEENREKIDYNTIDFPIEYLVNQFENKNFYIPNYQREFVWKNEQKSKFVESILMGIPIPFLFLCRNKNNGKLEIIDGAQRIQSLHQFLKNDLKLIDLKRIKSLNGCYYNDLPEKFRIIFSTTSLRTIILEDKTTDEFRKEIFNRLNTTSLKLEPIEVLLGSYDGEKFIEFLKKCAKNEKFKKLCPVSSEKLKRKEDIELVLRFFAYSDNLDNYRGKVTEFLEDYIKSKLNTIDIVKMEEEFKNMLNFVDNYFPNGFRKTTTSKSTPRTRFEAISIGVNLALRSNNKLISNKENIKKWLQSKEFEKVTTTDSANNKSKLEERINFVKNKLLEGNF